MPTDPRRPSVAALHEPPDVVAKLAAEDAALLCDLLNATVAAQHASLDRSLDRVLTVLPRLIRPAARRILFD